MKKEKTEPGQEKEKVAVAEESTKEAPKVKKPKAAKSKKEAEPAAPKEAKATKEVKTTKEAKATKEATAAKEDKSTKFLVSMKKSIRKALKKESAEIGVSMNDFIVSAVEAKLGLSPAKATKKSSKK